MGRGKRFIKWLKKGLFGKKKKASNVAGTEVVPAVSVGIQKNTKSDTIPNVALDTYMLPEASPSVPGERLTSLPQNYEVQEIELPNPPQSTLDVGVVGPSNGPKQGLPEVHEDKPKVLHEGNHGDIVHGDIVRMSAHGTDTKIGKAKTSEHRIGRRKHLKKSLFGKKKKNGSNVVGTEVAPAVPVDQQGIHQNTTSDTISNTYMLPGASLSVPGERQTSLPQNYEVELTILPQSTLDVGVVGPSNGPKQGLPEVNEEKSKVLHEGNHGDIVHCDIVQMSAHETNIEIGNAKKSEHRTGQRKRFTKMLKKSLLRKKKKGSNVINQNTTSDFISSGIPLPPRASDSLQGESSTVPCNNEFQPPSSLDHGAVGPSNDPKHPDVRPSNGSKHSLSEIYEDIPPSCASFHATAIKLDNVASVIDVTEDLEARPPTESTRDHERSGAVKDKEQITERSMLSDIQPTPDVEARILVKSKLDAMSCREGTVQASMKSSVAVKTSFVKEDKGPNVMEEKAPDVPVVLINQQDESQNTTVSETISDGSLKIYLPPRIQSIEARPPTQCFPECSAVKKVQSAEMGKLSTPRPPVKRGAFFIDSGNYRRLESAKAKAWYKKLDAMSSRSEFNMHKASSEDDSEESEDDSEESEGDIEESEDDSEKSEDDSEKSEDDNKEIGNTSEMADQEGKEVEKKEQEKEECVSSEDEAEFTFDVFNDDWRKHGGGADNGECISSGKTTDESRAGDDRSDMSSLAGKPKLRRKKISFNRKVKIFRDQDKKKPFNHPSTSTLKSCLSGRSKLNYVKPERQLPEKWVDTRIFPVMRDEEVVYEREDLNLFYRQKYFVCVNDRMRDPSYHLEQDRVALNTVEFRNDMRRRLREEEAEAMAETLQALKEKQLVKNKMKKSAEKRRKEALLETERKWREVNEILWKQEQRRKERTRRKRQMREEMARQEQRKEVVQMMIISTSSTLNSSSNPLQYRHQMSRGPSNEERIRFGYMPQSTRQISGTRISASVRRQRRLSPIRQVQTLGHCNSGRTMAVDEKVDECKGKPTESIRRTEAQGNQSMNSDQASSKVTDREEVRSKQAKHKQKTKVTRL